MNALIELEFAGCMIGMLYIGIMFLATIAAWHLFTFVMWCIYRYNGGKRWYTSYMKIKNLNL